MVSSAKRRAQHSPAPVEEADHHPLSPPCSAGALLQGDGVQLLEHEVDGQRSRPHQKTLQTARSNQHSRPGSDQTRNRRPARWWCTCYLGIALRASQTGQQHHARMMQHMCKIPYLFAPAGLRDVAQIPQPLVHVPQPRPRHACQKRTNPFVACLACTRLCKPMESGPCRQTRY